MDNSRKTDLRLVTRKDHQGKPDQHQKFGKNPTPKVLIFTLSIFSAPSFQRSLKQYELCSLFPKVFKILRWLVDRKPTHSAVTFSLDGFKMITHQAFVIMSNQTDLQNQDLKTVPSFKIKKVGYFLQINSLLFSFFCTHLTMLV